MDLKLYDVILMAETSSITTNKHYQIPVLNLAVYSDCWGDKIWSQMTRRLIMFSPKENHVNYE